MARQPLLPNYAKSRLVYGPAHIARKPKVAEAVGRCIMAWSYVEWLMALLLAAIMKANSEASVAIFLTLKNARTQKDVLAAAANVTLTGRDREIFDAILLLYGSLQAQRADLAHGIFGHVEVANHEEVVPWIETKKLSQNWLDTFHSGRKAPDSDNLAQKQYSSVYKLSDLERLEQEMMNLYKTQLLFYAALTIPTAANYETLEIQCTEPQIRNALAQVSASP